MASPGDPGGRALAFLKLNDRPPEPRTRGITEIRGPYYTPMGKRYQQDVPETMGQSGGSWSRTITSRHRS